MTTTLEVIDTAIKIGLGALISAAASFGLAKVNHTSEKNKRLFDRRLDRIEQAAEECVHYTTSLQHFLSALDGARRLYGAEDEIDLSSENHAQILKAIRNRDDDLCSQRENLVKATATLQLLGLRSEAEFAGKLWALEGKARTMTLFNKKLASAAEIKSWQGEAQTIRSDFFAALSSHYKA